MSNSSSDVSVSLESIAAEKSEALQARIAELTSNFNQQIREAGALAGLELLTEINISLKTLD